MCPRWARLFFVSGGSGFVVLGAAKYARRFPHSARWHPVKQMQKGLRVSELPSPAAAVVKRDSQPSGEEEMDCSGLSRQP